MIVASIPITFKSGRAADLLGHMTETGREYEFVPDITLPEGCTAVIEIVKPDGTFVIDACTISSGNIIVTIPAQALAVRGMAHYIIRITTADDKIIFSAAGTIWVDDALITDKLLQSISEVYGLVFPDDFLTSADLTNYITVDDLRAALSDYALKSEIIDVVANPSGAAAADLSKIKIGSGIYKIPDPLQIYSSQEHIIGQWIDGRAIYARTFTGSMPQGAGNHVLFTVDNFADIDVVINLERTLGVTGAGWYFPTVAGMSDRLYFTFNGQTGAFYAIVINDNYYNYHYYITMYYVKREV